MDSSFFSNVLLTILFAVSGIIIINFFKKIKMHTAKWSFTVLYFVLLLYIPFYFGGFLTMNTFKSVFSGSIIESVFCMQMKMTIDAPFEYVKSITILTASIAIIIVAITIIITHITITCAVRWVVKTLKKRDISVNIDSESLSNVSDCLNIPSSKCLYLRYCRFLI